MEGDNEETLQAILAAFANLTDFQKAKVRESISEGKPSHTGDATHMSDVLSITPNVHSCHICKKLILSRCEAEKEPESPEQHEESWAFETSRIRLKKDILGQGRSRMCLVVRWVFEFLSHSLFDFKKELSDRGVRQVGAILTQELEDSANDLDYTHPKGIDIQMYFTTNGRSGWIEFAYDANPYLLDRLYSYSADYRNVMGDYSAFLSKHRSRKKLKARVFTAATEPSIPGIHVWSADHMTGPDAGFETASNWLEKCQDTHERCSRRAGLLPTRVIDLGRRYPIRSVRLYWSEDGEEGQYVALSYCWGGHQPVTTNRSTTQANTDGIIFSTLPKTIQDASTVAFKLGIRYLWVDCLCIIQDDPEDIVREIALMAQTFEQALVTISAASAASVQEGFLENRRTFQETFLGLPYGTTSSRVLVERIERAHDPATDPINLRAWTLQEHILSPRMLVYSTERIWWTCQESEASQARDQEDFADVPFMPSQRKNDPERYTLQYWRSIIQDYSRRFLTYPNDKFPAIAGVAARYSDVFKSRYLAGLWENHLLSELMWYSARSDITRPYVQRAPSWSWASVDGEIHHTWCPSNISNLGPRIEYCHVTPVSLGSPYGHVDPTRSVLQMTGELAPVAWRDSDTEYVHDTSSPTKGGPFYPKVGATQADAAENLPVVDNMVMLWVLPIVKNPIRGLLLYQVGEDTFRRVNTKMLYELKSRIRRFRVISRVLSLLISVGVLAPITMTIVKFLQTRNIYRPVAHDSGTPTYRTAWAHDSKLWPTYFYFGVALISTILNFVTILSYKFGVSRANSVSQFTSLFAWADMLGNVIIWAVAAAVYRNEKNKHGRSNDLWGWTCSKAAQTIQMDFAGELNFNTYCTVQSAGWYVGLAQVGAGVWTVVIYVLVSKRRGRKRVGQRLSTIGLAQ